VHLKNKLAHFLAGLITGITSTFNPVLSVITFIGFIVYEVIEAVDEKDKAWRDIMEYMVGLYASAVGIAILNTWSHI